MMDMMEGCFSIDNVKIEGRACKTNKVSNTSFRGFGIPQGYVAMETIVDHVAHALNTKPKKVLNDLRKSLFFPRLLQRKNLILNEYIESVLLLIS